MIKKFLFGSSLSTTVFAEIMVTAARIFIGCSMAFAHGAKKMPPSEPFIGGVTALGFPAPELFAWLAGLSEFAGGLLLAAGLLTRPAALCIVLTMLVAGFGAHAADPFQKQELSLLYLSCGVIFFALGGGRLSLDRLFRGK